MNLFRNPVIIGVTSILLIAPLSSIAQQSADSRAVPSLHQAGINQDSQAIQVTLADAIARAKKLSPTLSNALAQSKLAAGAAIQARSAILPNVTGISQYLYTEGNGTLAARFIANNGVHEYIAQADVHQAISGPLYFQYRRAALLRAIAQDQFTIAQRGLLVTVVQAYANYFGARGKLATAEETLDSAQNFLKITQERQKNGDAAYADVLKARIQADDIESAVSNARLVLEQSRVALALLIFEDVNQPFELADDPSQALSLPARDEAQALASHANPELDAAEKNASAARKDLTAARLGFMPSLTFDYFYGIDANQFATEFRLPDGRVAQNLGYSALGSLTMPIFTWGSTWSKVRDARSLNQAAKTDLAFAHRKAVGDFQMFYDEAQVAAHDLKVREDAYNDAVQSRKLTLLQYRAGAATALEVVTAESAVDTESAALYDAKTRFATAIANLAKLTGRL